MSRVSIALVLTAAFGAAGVIAARGRFTGSNGETEAGRSRDGVEIAAAAPGSEKPAPLPPGSAAPLLPVNLPPARFVPFDPPRDPFRPESVIDLRKLNEPVAGSRGFVVARNGRFHLGAGGPPVRFWGVNGVAATLPKELRYEARHLAKYGVNLVRLYAEMFDARGEPNLASAKHAAEVVDALKAEGIYTLLSIYFPFRWKPPADLAWMPGYDGKTPAFAALFFNREFQKRYRAWWHALMHARTPSGKRLRDEPAVMGAELVNEDSLFFWTFNETALPPAQLELFESAFADWLRARHGTLAAATARWNQLTLPRDRPDAGRLAFRPLWNIAHERTPRDEDTARFLAETERNFYSEQIRVLRALGFRGLITTSNWHTASPDRLGPIEKYVYTLGDFQDRHAYFGCKNRGEHADWSLRDGHTYVDRSALRFEPEEPEKDKTYVHPTFEVQYDQQPTLLSEVSWNRPNRYRGEAPLFLAAYGALHDLDGIGHHAKDGVLFRVQPQFFMQPWTLMSPTMIGQFPAAALIYRNGLVRAADVVAALDLDPDEILRLAGTPLAQDAALDVLRAEDVPTPAPNAPNAPLSAALPSLVDPLAAYVGRLQVNFRAGTAPRLTPLGQAIDRRQKRLRSRTGELTLDYGQGLLTITAPAVEGASGNLARPIALPTLAIDVPLDVAHVVAVSLDGQPLASARRILLQVMTEEQATGFRSEPVPQSRDRKILSIGKEPWQLRELTGTVAFKRPDAATLRAVALDHLGHPTPRKQPASAIRLEPGTLYYLVEAPVLTPPAPPP